MTTLVDENQFAFMQNEWNSLLQQSLNPSFFLSHEWLYGWWRVFGRGRTLFIIQVRDAKGMLLALAPLCIENQYFNKFFSYRSIRMIGTNQANPDYLGFILHREKGIGIINNILQFLYDHAHKWDELDIESLPLEDKGGRSLLCRLSEGKNHLRLTFDHKTMYIELADNFETYLAGFSRKHRYNLRRQYRQFSKDYQGRFGQAETVEMALQVLHRLFYLHRLRADSIGRAEAFFDSRIRDMHVNLIHEQFNTGRICLYYLQIGDAYEACLYGFRYGDRFYFYQMGYNPDYDHISLGTTMVQKSIEQCILNGGRFFDFLRGEEDYKQRWTKMQRAVKYIKIYHKNPKGMFLYSYRIIRNLMGRLRRHLMVPFLIQMSVTSVLY